MVHTGQVCAVARCGSSSYRDKGVKFHQFPRDERCFIWIEALKRIDLLEKVDKVKNMYVCSLHFEPHMYGKRLLKRSAVPTLNLFDPAPETSTISVQTEAQVPQVETVSQAVQTDELDLFEEDLLACFDIFNDEYLLQYYF